jgi:short-subunit dehydrogenase
MKKAIVIGATSGIGRELAKILFREGYAVGVCGRREDLLKEFIAEHPDRSFMKRMDVSRSAEAMAGLEELILEMGGVDLVVISAGVGFNNPELEWRLEKDTIDVNVSGFSAMANVAMRHFIKQGVGHLVGISSIAAIRGNGNVPAYFASKAFVSNYLEALQHKAVKLKLPITVTEIQPGFVDTAMAKGEGIFWMASAATVAEQIFRAIGKKKKHAYVTRRWRLIAWMMKIVPDCIYFKI